MDIENERGKRKAPTVRDRFTPLFAVGFAVVTLADITTTYVCVHHLGLGEVNPFTDTSSYWGLLWPELIAWVLGTIAVRYGFLFGRKKGLVGGDGVPEFSRYRRRLLLPKNLPFAILVIVPVGLMLGRLVPVVSNSCFIAFGVDPYDSFLAFLVARYDWDVYKTYIATQVVLLAVWTFVAIFVVFRIARKSAVDPFQPPCPIEPGRQ